MKLKRYTLMNDDEEFNASPNEYYTDSEEEENHQKDRRNHQVKVSRWKSKFAHVKIVVEK